MAKYQFKAAFVSIKESDCCPPEGIAHIGTYLLRHLPNDVEVKIIDQSFDNIEQAIRMGNFEANLRQMVSDYKITDYVEFIGIVSDEEVERLVCGSAVGIAPYVDDPFSNKRFTEPTKPKTYLGCGSVCR